MRNKQVILKERKHTTHPALLAFIVLLVSLSSCVHDPFVEPEPNLPIITGEIPCDPDTAYFVNDVYPILKSSCAFSGCHDATSAMDGVNLTSYTTIMQTADVRPFNLDGSDLYEKITETDLDKRMPPPPYDALTPDQIATIARWINQGALENRCDECDTSDVSFALHIAPLIENNCKGCHSGSAPSAGINLVSLSDIQAAANNGSLYGAVAGLPGYTAMPYNQAPLNDCQIEQIQQWTEAGAPDN